MQAGFIGLGKMGRPMTQRLLAAGHTVHVFNRSRGAVDALVADGAQAADSAAEVASRADVIMSALPTPDSVESVYSEMAAVARRQQARQPVERGRAEIAVGAGFGGAGVQRHAHP